MMFLFLEDFKDCTESQIKDHISEEYAGDKSGFDYGNPTDKEKRELRAELDNYEILVAYESVGDYGCDSSSWFLLRDKKSKELFEVHGSHCSCFGFEGQWQLEPTTREYLNSETFSFGTGGYARNDKLNKSAVRRFLAKLAS